MVSSNTVSPYLFKYCSCGNNMLLKRVIKVQMDDNAYLPPTLKPKMIKTFSWLATRPSLKCFIISDFIKLKLIFKENICNHFDHTMNCLRFFKP